VSFLPSFFRILDIILIIIIINNPNTSSTIIKILIIAIFLVIMMMSLVNIVVNILIIIVILVIVIIRYILVCTIGDDASRQVASDAAICIGMLLTMARYRRWPLFSLHFRIAEHLQR